MVDILLMRYFKLQQRSKRCHTSFQLQRKGGARGSSYDMKAAQDGEGEQGDALHESYALPHLTLASGLHISLKQWSYKMQKSPERSEIGRAWRVMFTKLTELWLYPRE